MPVEGEMLIVDEPEQLRVCLVWKDALLAVGLINEQEPRAAQWRCAMR